MPRDDDEDLASSDEDGDDDDDDYGHNSISTRRHSKTRKNIGAALSASQKTT